MPYFVCFEQNKKGGIGKSTASKIVHDYFAAATGKVIMFDTDPGQQSVIEYNRDEFPVHGLPILKDDEEKIDKTKFDLVFDVIDKSEEHSGEQSNIVIDVGTASIFPLLEYMEENETIEIFKDDMGFIPVMNIVISGGNDYKDCFEAAESILSKPYLSDTYIIFWLNAFNGKIDVDADGNEKPFENTGLYKKYQNRCGGVVRLPKDDEYHTLSTILEHKKLFSEAIDEASSRPLKKRITTLRDQLFSEFEEALSVIVKLETEQQDS